MAIHPDLSDASGKIDESRGIAHQAGLYPNPRIDSGNPQVIGSYPTSVFSAGVMQEIVRGGKLKLQRAAAMDVSRQAEWEFVSRRFDVATNVRQAFFALLAAQERQALLRRLTVITRQLEEGSEALQKGGQVALSDVILARIERRKAESALQESAVALLGRRRELATAIGQSSLAIAAAAGNLAIKIPDFDDETVLLEVTEMNPRIRIAQIDIERANLVLRRAEVEPIPNVTIQGGWQRTQITPRNQALVGLYLDIPIWNRNQGNIAAAEAGIRRAAAQRDAVRNDLARQLISALARFHSANVSVKNYRQGILPDAKKALELVKTSYDRGLTDILRVLQAQRTQFEVNLVYIASLEERLDAGAEIAGMLQLEDFPGVTREEDDQEDEEN